PGAHLGTGAVRLLRQARLEPDYPFGWKDEQWGRVFDDFERHWGTPQSIAVTMYAPSLASDAEGSERRAAYFRASASPGAAISIMKMNRDIDVRQVLPTIRVPTLILHRTAERVINVVLQQYRGREINTSGDGILAAFDGPARAIRCAGAIRDRVRALGLEVRCGLHTGECEVLGKDLAGIAVHIGARVARVAAPVEVPASRTVRDLVAGSGLVFE